MDHNTHTVDSTYRQFYVADEGLDPDAPEDWNAEHLEQRFNALPNIVALCPAGDVSARVICVPPGERYANPAPPAFEVHTQVTISSGRLGVFGWPREPLEVFPVEPGTYRVRFCGYDLGSVDSEEDYYVVEFEPV